MIYIGTSGYNYWQWQGDFYPKDLPKTRWLEYYSTQFKTVEINATFYGSFKPQTFKKWGDSTPRDFVFAIKGTRFLTHIARLNNPEESVNRFFDSATGLDGKLGVVLWQFPPSFGNTSENNERLTRFIDLLPAEIPQVFEFRHPTWFDNEVYKMLNNKRVGIVISESSRFPEREVVTGGICYIRFHGPTSLYSSSYSTSELKVWAKKIQKWSRNSQVYCYFNNDNGGHAVRNAAELATILGHGIKIVQHALR